MQLANRLAPLVLWLTLTVLCPSYVQASPAPLLDTLTWATVSPGVQYAVGDSATGEGVFIGFAGWTVQQTWANTWVSNLYTAKLRSLGVRHLYSVKGPIDSEYYDREIGTLDLGRHLIALLSSSPGTTRVIIAAHSSGAYVAHALFQDLYTAASIDSNHATDGKIIYFNLDGGIGGGGTAPEITKPVADRLGHIYAVYASVPAQKLNSPNMAEMITLANLFPPKSSVLQLNSTGCGCSATWCVHETMINQVPYNHSTFDLANDYGGINAQHPVATAYLNLITSVDHESPRPEGFLLEQNYPNPFNPSTLIKYSIPESSERGVRTMEAKLIVYDILGRDVMVLVDGKKGPGNYDVTFDGSSLSSGVYVYRLTTGAYVESRKMVLMK